MIRAVLILIALPAMANADVLICEFEVHSCLAQSECQPLRITINTHHGADTPRFEYDGIDASILQIPNDSAQATSFVTLGHADREIITLFNGFDAIHTRHYIDGGTPTAQTSTGLSTSFY